MFKYKEELVSVIMTAYNAEAYIKDAIESILRQTYKNFEFIIIDDGSVDSTWNIIDHYRKIDNRIIGITRKNIGLAESLNDGVRMARGKYIARMDADDISYPTRFEKQISYMNDHPDVFMLGTGYETMYSEELTEECVKKYKNAEERGKLKIDSQNILLSISECQKFMHPSAMIKKEFYDIVGLYNEVMTEDIELTFRAAAYGLKIAKLDEVLYGYRAREDSKSYTESKLRWSEGLINAKLKWLIGKLDDEFKNANYYIWGADISGEIALDCISQQLTNSSCLGYIDPYKAGGTFCSKKIIAPEEIDELEFDYIFICTQAGAVMARKLLNDMGLKEVNQFFKIS